MKKIAVTVEHSRAYGRAVIEGIAKFAHNTRDWVLRPLSFKDALSARLDDYDGAIVRIAGRRIGSRFRKSSIPVVDVFCQNPIPGIAGVACDDVSIARLARRFFKERRFDNVAFCGYPGAAFSDLRQSTFAGECGGGAHVYAGPGRRTKDESQFYAERANGVSDAKELGSWVASLPKPVAVFCCNDIRALQLQRAALERGLSVPGDVAILGVDIDTTLCAFAEIPISSIDPNAFGVGYTAARTLKALIAGGRPSKRHPIHRVKCGGIVERASTEFVPVDPPWLGGALMHIERNMGRPVGAAEIFALSGKSATHVENVFRRRIGMTVQAYVMSVKLREAKRLLSDPSLRISEVAYACGFSSPQYFTRIFTAATGEPPTVFRARRR